MLQTRAVFSFLLLWSCAHAQCPADDVLGGLGNPGVAYSILEHDDGSGPQVWVSGALGRPLDFGVRRLVGTMWQGVGSPFRKETVIASHNAGSGLRLYGGSDQGVQVWNGTNWSPVGSRGATSALHVANLGTGDVLLAASDGVDRWTGTAWVRDYQTPFTNTPYGPMPGSVRVMANLRIGSVDEVWVGGVFGATGNVNLARRLVSGTWSSAGIASNGGVAALHVHDDGSGPAMYVGGNFSTIGGVPAPGLARWNGSAWSAVGSGLGSSVLSLCSHDAGAGARLFAGLGDGRVMRLDPTGFTLIGRANGPIVSLRALVSRGTLAVSGLFSGIAGLPALGVAEWSSSGWALLGNGLTSDSPGIAHALCAVAGPAGPELYVGGEFAAAGTVAAENIAQFSGGAWHRLGNGLRSASASNGARVNAVKWHTDAAGSALYVGGSNLDLADDTVPIANIGRWDGAQWTSPGGGLPGGFILGLESFGGSLFAVSSAPTPYGQVARWDGAAWHRADQGIGPSYYGKMHVVDWGFGSQLLLVTSAGLMRWSGAGWTPLGTIGSVGSCAAFDDGAGPKLYACRGADIVRWSAGAWQPIGTVSGALARAVIEVVDDGSGPRLWAVGSFTALNGLPVASAARWDGQTWSALPFGGLGDAIRSSTSQLAIGEMIVNTNMGVFVGGQFGSAGGTTVNGIARWQCGVSPSILWSQPGGAGQPVTLMDTGLVQGNTYFNLLSLDLCPAGPGTGPFLGLCASTASALQFLSDQVMLPLGTPLIHFGAQSTTAVWGPFTLPGPITFDVVSVDVTHGLIGAVSRTARIVVQ